MSHLNILAFDLSLTATGVCLPDGETATFATKTSGAERLYVIRQEIIGLLRWNKPDVIVLEGYSYRSKGRAVVDIGELGGVIRLAIWEHDIPCVEIPPASLKKYICGLFPDNNAADALGLWYMAMEHYCPGDPRLPKMPKDNLMALDKVPWVEWKAE